MQIAPGCHFARFWIAKQLLKKTFQNLSCLTLAMLLIQTMTASLKVSSRRSARRSARCLASKQDHVEYGMLRYSSRCRPKLHLWHQPCASHRQRNLHLCPCRLQGPAASSPKFFIFSASHGLRSCYSAVSCANYKVLGKRPHPLASGSPIEIGSNIAARFPPQFLTLKQ